MRSPAAATLRICSTPVGLSRKARWCRLASAWRTASAGERVNSTPVPGWPCWSGSTISASSSPTPLVAVAERGLVAVVAIGDEEPLVGQQHREPIRERALAAPETVVARDLAEDGRVGPGACGRLVARRLVEQLAHGAVAVLEER